MDQTQTVSLGTTEGGRKFYPLNLVVICTEAPASVGLCSLSCGTNGSSCNNIVPAILLTTLSDLRSVKADVGTSIAAVEGGTELKVKVPIAAPSGGTMRVALVGIYGDYE